MNDDIMRLYARLPPKDRAIVDVDEAIHELLLAQEPVQAGGQREAGDYT